MTATDPLAAFYPLSSNTSASGAPPPSTPEAQPKPAPRVRPGEPFLDLLVRYEDETLIGKSPLTVQKHQGALLRFGKWFQPRSILDATTRDVTDWIDSLQVSAGTRSDRIGSLHRFYEWLFNQGVVVRDPAAPLVRARRQVTPGEVPELLHNWRIAQERKNLAQSTIRARHNIIRRLSFWLEPKTITDASSEDIETWLDSRGRNKGPLAPQVRYYYISSLHMFYHWARKQGLVREDPTENIDRPRVPVGVPRPIPDDELSVALELAEPIVKAILALAAFGGLRAKEIAGLRREDILDHLDPPTIIITAPKGRRQRTVPLHPAAWEAVSGYGPPRVGYLFQWPTGRQWDPRRVSEVANEYLGSLGITSTLHKLRHFFATKVYAASLDLRLTQELLGHASPTTTTIYTAYNRAGAADAVAKVAISGPTVEKAGTA